MIKINRGIAIREPVPRFLTGLAPESLADLSWTDPALGVVECAWWPEDDQSPALGEFERYGAETLTPDAERQVVVVVRAVLPWAADEIAEYRAAETLRISTVIADRRFTAETAGIDVDGLHIDTGRDSQALITGAAVAAILDSGYTLRWKVVGGAFIDLNAEQVLAVASAVRAHVQACFDREADLLQAVSDKTITDEMIESGWPV